MSLRGPNRDRLSGSRRPSLSGTASPRDRRGGSRASSTALQDKTLQELYPEGHSASFQESDLSQVQRERCVGIALPLKTT